MTMVAFEESVVEVAAPVWLKNVGLLVKSDAMTTPSETTAERDDYGLAVLALGNTLRKPGDPARGCTPA